MLDIVGTTLSDEYGSALNLEFFQPESSHRTSPP